jgi:hypothetical protein
MEVSMQRLHRALFVLALLLFVVFPIGVSRTFADTTPATPQAPAACATGGAGLTGEDIPTGVIREKIGFEEMLPRPTGSTTDSVTTVIASSIVCIEAGTQVKILNIVTLEETVEVAQWGETWIAVLDGELQIKLDRLCVNTDATACTGTSGVAHYRPSGASTDTALTAGSWQSFHAGDRIYLSGVTVEYQTPASSIARFATFGIRPPLGVGSGCPAACWQFP